MTPQSTAMPMIPGWSASRWISRSNCSIRAVCGRPGPARRWRSDKDFAPPVGVVLFVTSGIARLRFERLVLAIRPYLLIMLAVLALVPAFPILSLGLPGLPG